LLNTWLLLRRHGDIGDETHHILHTTKTGTDWPVNSQYGVTGADALIVG
jgi:hypothetical protein